MVSDFVVLRLNLSRMFSQYYNLLVNCKSLANSKSWFTFPPKAQSVERSPIIAFLLHLQLSKQYNRWKNWQCNTNPLTSFVKILQYSHSPGITFQASITFPKSCDRDIARLLIDWKTDFWKICQILYNKSKQETASQRLTD